MEKTKNFTVTMIFYFFTSIILCSILNLWVWPNLQFQFCMPGSGWEEQYTYQFDSEIDEMYSKFLKTKPNTTGKIEFNNAMLNFTVIEKNNNITYGFIKMGNKEIAKPNPKDSTTIKDMLIVTDQFSIRSYNEDYLFCAVFDQK